MRTPSSREREIAERFCPTGRLHALRAHGHGLINDTFLVTPEQGPPFILQRLNPRVFAQPQQVMANLRTLVAHVRARHATGAGLRLPEPLPARDGRDFLLDDDGALWRALTYIDNTRSLGALDDPQQAEEIGRALGRFHRLAHDLDPVCLHVTLPGFHVTPQYLARYDTAARNVDPTPEWDDCRAFVAARRGLANVLEAARGRGELALRTIHGDPKLDNFLFDPAGRRVVGLIDLDTVQPGFVHVDLGDCLRSACNRAGECPAEPRAVRFDAALGRAILGGYLAEARAFLGAADRHFLYDAIRLIPFELGLRFLTDHLEGDRYFRTEWRGQNLTRARAQFALVASIEDQERELCAAIVALLAD